MLKEADSANRKSAGADKDAIALILQQAGKSADEIAVAIDAGRSRQCGGEPVLG